MLASIARNSISVQRQKTIGGERSLTVGNSTLDNLATPVIPATVVMELRDDGDTVPSNASCLITGTDINAATITETVEFLGSKFAQGIKLFATINTIVASNLSGWHIYAKYRGIDGSTVKAQSDLFGCIQCQISYTQQSWPNGRSGTVETGKVKFMIPMFCNDAAQLLRSGDLITDRGSGSKYLVNGMAFIDGVGVNRFQVVYGERRERT